MDVGILEVEGLKPIRQEKTIEIMVEEIREKIIELPKIQYLEKIVEYIKPVIKYKIKEVRRPVYVERILHVPKIVEEEKIIEIPQIKYVEKIVQVPTYVYKERIVEVPIPMIREIIIPVLRVHRVEKEVEIPTIPFVLDDRVDHTGENEVFSKNIDYINDKTTIDLKDDLVKKNLIFGFEEHVKDWVKSWRRWSFNDFKLWKRENEKECNYEFNDKEIIKDSEFKRNNSFTNVNLTSPIGVLGISKIPPTESFNIVRLNNITGSCYLEAHLHTLPNNSS